LSAVADSKGGNASTGALQVSIFTFQLAAHIELFKGFCKMSEVLKSG
jgi:hypothetical protein